MAGELQAFSATSQTLYAVLMNAAGQAWNGATWETIQGANWTTYDIPLTETTAGIYIGNMPVVTAGSYTYAVYLRAGGSPAITDTLKGLGGVDWDGSSVIEVNELEVLILAIKDKTDNLPADTNTLLTSTGIKIASIANGAIAAATFAAGALDAVWSTATRTLTAISDSAGITTLLSRIIGTLATGTHQPQSGDSYARLGAPSGASVSADVAAIEQAIADLHDFDPANDVVAHVTLVDTTTTLTNAPDLSGVEQAIADLHDFDPANDVVARVTLVDTVTTVDYDAIAATVAEVSLDQHTVAGTWAATTQAILDRIEEQVPEGPVVVIPAPEYVGQTVAWCICYDSYGEPEPGAKIYVRVKSGGTSPSAYDSRPAVATANADGMASVLIPKDAGLIFEVKRGNGPWVAFPGQDVDDFELPSVTGTP